jgi:Tol biopolymer transport system component
MFGISSGPFSSNIAFPSVRDDAPEITRDCGQLAVVPNEHSLIFSAVPPGSSRCQLFRLDCKDGTYEQLVHSEFNDTNPVIAPTGDVVAFMRQTDGQHTHVFLLDLASGDTRQLTNYDGRDLPGAFAPDGKSLYIIRGDLLAGKMWTDIDVYRVQMDSGAAQQITNNEFNELYDVSVSPDGRSMVVSIGHPFVDKNDLFLVTIDAALPIVVKDEHRVRITGIQSDDSYENNPTFSPDGSRIVFVADWNKEFHGNVCEVRVDGTDPRTITDGRRYCQYPAYTSPGHVVFVDAIGPNPSEWQHQIMEADIETGETRVLYPPQAR